jgi:hypothetical protein
LERILVQDYAVVVTVVDISGGCMAALAGAGIGSDRGARNGTRCQAFDR